MIVAGIVLFSVAAGLIVFVLITADWHRAVAILRAGPTVAAPEPDRWRRVHLDADRRQPFGHGERR